MTDLSLPLHEALGHTTSDKRLEVLRRVGHTGSISQAARDVGISYKAAWQAIDTLTSLSGWPLVDRSVGGSGGGGARLTAQGVQLLALADELAQARAQVLARFAAAQRLSRDAGLASPQGLSMGVWGSGGVGLRTSMRNQLPCTVVALRGQDHGPMVCVELASAGGGPLASWVTQESADLLGLARGLEVLALCKATAVTVVRAAGAGLDTVLSHRAQEGEGCVLQGKLADASDGQGPIEVAMVLPGGHLWVGFAETSAPADVPSVPWVVGEPVTAMFAPSALVIGLPG